MLIDFADYVSLAVFVIVVAGGGIGIGFFSVPGAWYAGLKKPFFNPPNWIFAPVWTVLYLFISIAGWRVWQIDPYGLAMKLWLIQLGLNFSWSPLFFLAHRVAAALIVICVMFLSVFGFSIVASRIDLISTALFLPYVAWVAFASALNGSILYLNTDRFN